MPADDPSTLERVLRQGRRLRRRRRAAQSILGALILAATGAGVWAALPDQASTRVTVARQPRGSTPSFPPSIYPPPAKPIGKGAISLPPGERTFVCPDPKGLVHPSSGADAGVLAALNGLDRSLLDPRGDTAAKHSADPAAWPLIASMWSAVQRAPTRFRAAERSPLKPQDVLFELVTRSTYGDLLQNLCGARTLSDSVAAIYCSLAVAGRPLAATTCLRARPALTNYAYFLDRDGHWLLWSVEGGG